MTDKSPSRGKPTGAGSEAAVGIHAADGEKSAAADQRDRQADGDSTPIERKGSEPTQSHSTEHVSGYGGAGGEPKNG